MRCKNYEPEPTYVPALSYFLGKPVAYWMTLESQNQRLIKKIGELESDLKDYDGRWTTWVQPEPTITTYLGKPLEYWSNLEHNRDLLAEDNRRLISEKRNLLDRIDKALDYLKP